MTRDEAIQKATKLLRLATSENSHESAQAAAKAQEILDRYEISRNMLELDGSAAPEPQETVVDFARKGAPLDETGKNKSTWKGRLAVGVCAANGCKAYADSRGGVAALHIIGRPSDADKVRYLYAYLVRECDRLAERDGKGCGRTWANNFRLGFVSEVCRRLAESRQVTIDAMKAEAVGLSTGGTATALMRIDQAALALVKRGEDAERYGKTVLRLHAGRAPSVNYDRSAREQGQAAGREVGIGAARGALGVSQRRIGGE